MPLALATSCSAFGPSPAPTVTVTATETVTVSPEDPDVGEELPPTWAETYADVGSGVVRVETYTCDGPGSVGAAFLVAPTLLVTAGHVVDDAVIVNVDAGDRGIPLTVVGVDVSGDVALLVAPEPLPGTVLDAADELPPQGTEIAVIGYPFGTERQTVTRGIVSALDVPVSHGEIDRDDFLQTDTAINGGNSGGPAITVDGEVVGVVSSKQAWTFDLSAPAEATGWIVPFPAVRDQISSWAEGAVMAEPSPCPGDNGVPPIVSGFPEDAHAAGATQVLVDHGTAINEGRYAEAFEFLGDELRERAGDLDTWAVGLRSSSWERIDVLDTDEDDEGVAVSVRLVTRQDALWGTDGQTCTTWTNRYRIDGPLGDGLFYEITDVELLEEPEDCVGD